MLASERSTGRTRENAKIISEELKIEKDYC